VKAFVFISAFSSYWIMCSSQLLAVAALPATKIATGINWTGGFLSPTTSLYSGQEKHLST